MTKVDLDEVVAHLHGLISDIQDGAMDASEDECDCDDWDDDGLEPLTKALAESVRDLHRTKHDGAMQWCDTEACRHAQILITIEGL